MVAIKKRASKLEMVCSESPHYCIHKQVNVQCTVGGGGGGIRAVSTSFLFQITMNDNIIMSKQLFMIPERKACRLHNVRLFTD